MTTAYLLWLAAAALIGVRLWREHNRHRIERMLDMERFDETAGHYPGRRRWRDLA